MTVPEEYFLMNYGSFWQLYALREVIKRLGYRPFRMLHRTWLRSVVKYALTPVLIWKENRLSRSSIRTRFAKDYRRVIGKIFEHPHNETAAYVVGSDSIWMIGDPVMFLLDRDRPGKKISYAASSAWDIAAQSSWWPLFMKKVDASYCAVSVREEIGRGACQEYMPHHQVQCVLDPTMLLDKADYNSLVTTAKFFDRPVLLYYVVNICSEESLRLELLKATAQKLGCELKIIGIQGAEKYAPKEFSIEPSPLEFIRTIRDASHVVTNSFHGLAFSIIFRKSFAFLTQVAHVYGDQNCRQNEILSKMHLTDRRLSSDVAMANELVDVLSKPVDVGALESCHAEERARSLKWLQEALA